MSADTARHTNGAKGFIIQGPVRSSCRIPVRTMSEPRLEGWRLETRPSLPRRGRTGIFLVFIGLVALGAAVGSALYISFVAVQGQIETLQTNIKASVDEQTSVAERLEEIAKSQVRIEAAVARLEAAAQPAAQFEPRPKLSASDLELLRSFFRLTRTEGVLPKFKLGDLVSSTELKAMPEFVVEKVSAALKGTRFLFDRNGSLVITAGPNNEVVAIVSG